MRNALTILLFSAGVAAAQGSQGERVTTETEVNMGRGASKYTTTEQSPMFVSRIVYLG